jgi:multidrug transporter EmrE-like cation transporter/transposase
MAALTSAEGMQMAWIVLVVAGLFEVCWAIGLKYTDGFTRLWPSVGTVAAMTISVVLLGWAMRTLPVGTAYAVWTGIGAVGTVLLGIVLFGEPANGRPARLRRSGGGRHPRPQARDLTAHGHEKRPPGGGLIPGGPELLDGLLGGGLGLGAMVLGLRLVRAGLGAVSRARRLLGGRALDVLGGLLGGPPELDIHLVMDNYGTHKTPAIRSWFARNPRFHVHFTPTSASWLNQVERWFATLTQSYIRRGTHRSTQQLEQAIRRYLEHHNTDPKPFVWSKSADDILASIERFCLRTSNSRQGHTLTSAPPWQPTRTERCNGLPHRQRSRQPGSAMSSHPNRNANRRAQASPMARERNRVASA